MQIIQLCKVTLIKKTLRLSAFILILITGRCHAQEKETDKKATFSMVDSGYDANLSILKMRLLSPKKLTKDSQIEIELMMQAEGAEIEISGYVQLDISKARDSVPIDGWFRNIFPLQYFTLESGKTISLKFPLQVPADFEGIARFHFVAYDLKHQMLGSTHLDLNSKE